MRVTGIDIMEGVNREELTATMVEELPAFGHSVIRGLVTDRLMARREVRHLNTWFKGYNPVPTQFFADDSNLL